MRRLNYVIALLVVVQFSLSLSLSLSFSPKIVFSNFFRFKVSISHSKCWWCALQLRRNIQSLLKENNCTRSFHRMWKTAKWFDKLFQSARLKLWQIMRPRVYGENSHLLVRESITVRLTSCLTGSESAALLSWNNQQVYLFVWIQTSKTRGQAVLWYLP